MYFFNLLPSCNISIDEDASTDITLQGGIFQYPKRSECWILKKKKGKEEKSRLHAPPQPPRLYRRLSLELPPLYSPEYPSVATACLPRVGWTGLASDAEYPAAVMGCTWDAAISQAAAPNCVRFPP